MEKMLKDAMYVMDDDLKDAEYYAGAVKRAKMAKKDECAAMYATKARRRVDNDYEESKKILKHTMEGMKNTGMADVPESMQGHLWAAAMERYDHWADRIRAELKHMGY